MARIFGVQLAKCCHAGDLKNYCQVIESLGGFVRKA